MMRRATAEAPPLTLNARLATGRYVGTRSSDRPGIPDRPPLAVKSIMDEVEQIGRGRKLKGYRVAFKKNAKGENVVALLWPPQTP